MFNYVPRGTLIKFYYMDIRKIIKVLQFILKVIAIFLGSFCGSSCANNGEVVPPEIADTLNIDFLTIND